MKTHFGVITEPFKAEVHQTELREIRNDEVLVKMEACNICTGDYTQFIGLRNHQGFPHAGGHEWVGRIIKKGSEVADLFKIGDRVGAVPGNLCGQCSSCNVGDYIECPVNDYYKQGEDGYFGDKLFATYAIVKSRNLIKVSAELPSAHAAMLEPLSTCIQAAKQGNVRPPDDVVIIGAGTMGLLNAQTARAFGGKIYITELSKRKIERAKSMGFAEVIDITKTDPAEKIKSLTDGKGADVVYVCVGNTAAYKQAFSLLKQFSGRLVVFPAGYPKPTFDIEPNDIHYRRLKIVGAYGSTFQDFYDAAAFLNKKLVDVSFSMEGKEFPLGQFEEGLRYAAEPDRYRVTIDLSRL